MAGNAVCLVRSDIVVAAVAVAIVLVKVYECKRANCLAKCCAYEIQPLLSYELIWRSSEITLTLFIQSQLNYPTGVQFRILFHWPTAGY